MMNDIQSTAEPNPWPMLLWLVLGPVPLILALAFHSHAPARPEAEARRSRQVEIMAAADSTVISSQIESKAERRAKEPQTASRR
jgi:hypothetical protein